MGTKSDFNFEFLWDFILLFLSIVMCITQGCNGSYPGMAAFALISYILFKLLMMEKDD